MLLNAAKEWGKKESVCRNHVGWPAAYFHAVTIRKNMAFGWDQSTINYSMSVKSMALWVASTQALVNECVFLCVNYCFNLSTCRGSAQLSSVQFSSLRLVQKPNWTHNTLGFRLTFQQQSIFAIVSSLHIIEYNGPEHSTIAWIHCENEIVFGEIAWA